jgi:hypothetical protein
MFVEAAISGLGIRGIGHQPLQAIGTDGAVGNEG